MPTISPLKIILLSQSDSGGGAARACFRLTKALSKLNVICNLEVAIKRTDSSNVNGPKSNFHTLINMLRPHFVKSVMGTTFKQSLMSSPAFLPSFVSYYLNSSSCDVVNLHWINNEFMSIRDIGKIRKPIVWTLHDMWPFCGAEHYAPDDLNARWRAGYTKENDLSSKISFDVDRWAWNRKLKNWVQPMHIVTPSKWLSNCVKDSHLMRRHFVTVIPNPLNVSIFRPWDKKVSRDMMGLPENIPLIMFGAIGGSADLRKGFDLLASALNKVSLRLPKAECIIFGQSLPRIPPNLGLKIHWMGHVFDDIALALLYSAADVMVVPSRQENLPQSGTEAQACGCPVVAFNTTGLPDVVIHGETGYLATAFDVDDLANGILWVLEDCERRQKLGAAGRARATLLWSEEAVCKQYLDVYKRAKDCG